MDKTATKNSNTASGQIPSDWKMAIITPLFNQNSAEGGVGPAGEKSQEPQSEHGF